MATASVKGQLHGLLSLSAALTAGWHQFILFFQEFTVSLRLSSSQSLLRPATLVTFT